MKFFCGKSLKKSYRLIPLLSPVVFRETVPLKKELANGVEQNLCINFFPDTVTLKEKVFVKYIATWVLVSREPTTF